MTSPLAVPDPWNLVAGAYTDELLPNFEHFSREALRLAALASPARVLDVACGPGTLTLLATQAGHRVAALDFSANMIALLRGRIEAAGVASQVEAREGDGMGLPFGDASFDAAFSMFGLMFFPDRAKGFRELLRAVVPGAPVIVSSWVPFQRILLMNDAFTVLSELAPPPPGTPAFTPPLSTSADCIAEMSAAGFRDVAVHEVSFEVAVPSVAEFWAMMVRTSAPIALRKRMLGASFEALSQAVAERLRTKYGDGPQTLTTPALLTYGRR